MFVLTTTIKTLLCLMFLGISRQETPQYSYECKENGDLVLHGFSLDSFIQLESVNDMTFGTDDNCTTSTYSSDKYGHISIPKDCINGTNVAINRTVVFRAYDSLIDGTITPPITTPKPIITPSPTTPSSIQTQPTIQATLSTVNASTSPKPSGGTSSRKKRNVSTLSYGQRYHYFSIQCNAILTGVVDHVIGHVGVKNIAPLPNVFNSVGSIEMRFKSEKATENTDLELLPDISSVYIGDKFYMYLKYMGSQAYSISPQACTAYGGDKRAVVQNDAKKAELWKYVSCATDTSINYHLMHNFMQMSDSKAKIVYAEMFGFNFVDDGDITIECDVKICRDASDAECVFKQSSTTTCPPESNWSVRKRRSPTGDNTKVYGTLKVLNRNNSNSAGINHVNWMCLVLVQLVFLWKRE